MKNSFWILLCFIGASQAMASPNQPVVVEESPSPALQMARRVASMENGRDLPSRAVWLGKKAARNSKVAFRRNNAKKKPVTTQN